MASCRILFISISVYTSKDTDDYHRGYMIPAKSVHVSHERRELTIWTDGVIVVLFHSAWASKRSVEVSSLHLMSINSMSKEEMLNLLCNLFHQLSDSKRIVQLAYL